MSRQLKDLNDMLTSKEKAVSECVTAEQKQESLRKQQQLEAKVNKNYSDCAVASKLQAWKGWHSEN